MDVDRLFAEIGESGKAQLKYGFLLCILKMYTPFHILQYTFVARSTSFHCISDNKTLTDSCFENQVSKCDSLRFEENTIVSEKSVPTHLGLEMKISLLVEI